MKQSILLFFCLIIISPNISAQFYSLNLPFVKESAEPELFMLEPHYDTQYTVTHYTLGNLLKVEYNRNNQGNPLKKVSYKWDKYDLAWEKNDETTYKYDAFGRLTEERTEMLYPKIEQNDIMYVKTTLALKQISYDPTSNTDTIWESICIPKVGNYYGHSDTTHIIRYLNKYNLPDSVIMKKAYHGNFFPRQKSIYRYDNKQRNVFMEVFHQDYGSPFWKKNYTVRTIYEKNKITYTQTPEPLSEEEHKMLEEGYSELWESLYDPNPLIFSIEFDNKNRIVSKKLIWGENSILNAKYSYNKQGKTLVEHEQTIDARLFSQVEGFGVSIPDELKYLKYMVSYLGGNCSQSVYYNKNEENKLQLLMNIDNCYSSEGKQISSDMTRYEPEENGEFNDRRIIKTTYNKDGLSGEIIEYSTSDIEYVPDLLNNPDEKIILKNNEDGFRTYEEKYSFYDNAWYPQSKTYYKYDANGFQTYWEKWEYSNYDKKWEPKYCYSYMRDSLNRILLQEEKIRKNNVWESYNRECFAYNKLHNKTLTEEYKWIDSENYWKGISRDSMIYDVAGEILDEITYRWSDEQRKWQPSRKDSYENTDGGWKEIRFFWETNKWQPVSTSFRGRFPAEPNTWGTYYSRWNESTNDWRIESLEKETRLSNSFSLKETYYWNDELNLLEGRSHILTENLPNNSVKEWNNSILSLEGIDDLAPLPLEIRRTSDDWLNHTIRKTYSLWNYDTNDWTQAVRHTTTHKQNKEREFIFENYDKNTTNWVFDRKVLEQQGINDSITQIIYFSWDKVADTWKEERKQAFHYSHDNHTIPIREEYYEFDKGKNGWGPVCYGKKIVYKGKNAFQYFLWNNKTQKWDVYFMKTSSGWNASFYTWNSTQQIWQEIDYYKHDEIIKQFDSYFTTNYELNYDSLNKKTRK